MTRKGGGADRRPEAPAPKAGLHARNRHREGYDFPSLLRACPELSAFVAPNPRGLPSIDFGDPRAVRILNRALLLQAYGIRDWDLPAGYLCPPIPGRADYLHHLADLLAEGRAGIPRGAAVRVLDVGTGAACIYPLLGHREYGWSFLASDIDAGALASSARILKANPGLAEAVELRRQARPERIFEGLVGPDEAFEAWMCNPPFHASPAEAREGSRRKWRNLGRAEELRTEALNFGGRGAELWCPGGEVAFLGRMIEESSRRPSLCRWFTALLSRSSHLPAVLRALRASGAREVRVLDMAQGQKRSRIVAWAF